MIKKLIHIIFILLIPISAWSQRIRGTNISYEEGDWISFTQSRFIRSIQVTPNLVYAASEGGILRFDYNTREWLFPFTVSNGLPDNNVLVAAYDISSNLLWCATTNAISVYDPAAKIWDNTYFDNLGLPSDDPIVSIGFDNQNSWFETYSGKLYKSPSQFLVLNPPGLETDDFVTWYGRKGFVPEKLQQFNLSNSMMFIDDAVDYFIQDTNLRNFRFNYYVTDNWQILWAGTSGLGMFSANQRTGNMRHRPYGLLNPNVKAILKLNSEFWFGGVNQDPEVNGISVWNIKRDSWRYIEPRFVSRFRSTNINAIAATKESIWFASENGLVRYQKGNDRWRTYTVLDNLKDNKIHSLAGSGSTLWVGTEDGLDQIVNIQEKIDLISINHITPWQDEVSVYDLWLAGNIVYAGTEWGLFFHNMKTEENGFYHGTDGPQNTVVSAVAKSGDSLYVGTLNTLEVYDLRNKVWRGSPIRKVFGGTFINDLAATENAIWVGTDNGLYKYKVQEKYWRHFTVDDGLLDRVIQKIVPDNDYLYLGSPSGVTQFYWNSPTRID